MLTDNLLCELKAHRGPVNSLIFLSRGDELLTAAEEWSQAADDLVGVVKRWRVSTGELLDTHRAIDHSGYAAKSLDGDTLAWAGGGGKVRLVRLNPWEKRQLIKTRSTNLYHLAVAARKELLATAGNNHLWLGDLSTGAELAKVLPPLDAGYCRVAITPDGSLVAGASWDGPIALWSTDARTSRILLEDSSTRVSALQFTHDGARLAVSWDDKPDLALYRVDPFAPEWKARIPKGGGASLALSPSGDQLLIGSTEGDITILNKTQQNRKWQRLSWLRVPAGESVAATSGVSLPLAPRGTPGPDSGFRLPAGLPEFGHFRSCWDLFRSG